MYKRLHEEPCETDHLTEPPPGRPQSRQDFRFTVQEQDQSTSQTENDGGSSSSASSSSSSSSSDQSDMELMIDLVGYRRNVCREILFYVGVFFTLGLLYLITHWRPVWRVKMMKTPCPLYLADTVVILDSQGTYYAEKIFSINLCEEIFQGIEDFVNIRRWSESRNIDPSNPLNNTQKPHLRYFDHSHIRYVWKATSSVTGAFVRLRGLEEKYRIEDICSKYKGLTSHQSSSRRKLYGLNSIDIEVKSYIRLFVEEVFNPFYVFQIFSVTVWYCDNYNIFATCIVVITLISISVELYETRKQLETLRDMVSTPDTFITVIRTNGETEEVNSKSLVPGDVVCLPSEGCMLTYDAVLLTGNAVVDEGMLTGESVPVTKTPLAPLSADEIYSPETHARSTLFCGTNLIQTRFYADAKVKACVVRTGFSTAKGELVRSILHPNKVFFKFYSDSIKFIIVLFIMALLGLIYIAAVLILTHASTRQIVLQMLGIVTIAVPPSLPAAMTVGIIYAQTRLKKSGIFCISPPRINLSAKIQCFCFDKTGTLTEDGLDLLAVVPSKSHKFQEPVSDVRLLEKRNRVSIAMATCHSLTVINGELKGDPLDLKMFQAIGWSLEESGDDRCKYDLVMPTVVRPPDSKPLIDTNHLPTAKDVQEVGIVRQFTFSSSLQRMSVIVRILGANRLDVYAKGSPEQIVALCQPESVPKDFQKILHSYTSKGLRVIGLAYKPLDRKTTWINAQHMQRSSVESELRFLGLMILENKLKDATIPVIQELHDANIRTIMITGDNILTASSVARNCGLVNSSTTLVTVIAYGPEDDKPARMEFEMVEAEIITSAEIHYETESKYVLDLQKPFVQFAVNGKTFSIIEKYFPEYIEKICVQGAIFARMSPHQKTQLIKILQGLGLYVGMCGDGANDCGALRAAHTGISLSTAEASVASPFTSKIPDISCVPKLLKEGRAALVTSFCVFKFIALYSIIQFMSVLILIGVNIKSNKVSLHLSKKHARLSDYMFLYIDLFISTAISLFMGQTAAYHTLSRRRPSSSLVSPASIFSLITHTLLVIGFQVFTLFYVESHKWYKRPEDTDSHEERTHTYATTAIFYNSSFLYITLAFVLSRSLPYRKRIWTNVPFTLSLIMLTSFSAVLVLYPPKFIVDIFRIIPLPSMVTRLTILGISAIHFLFAFLFESYLIENGLFTQILKSLGLKKPKTRRHVVLYKEQCEDHCWPPIGQTIYAGEKHDFS